MLGRQVHPLSPAELAERRNQGLCYNSDEKFVRGHKCACLFYQEHDDTAVDSVEWDATNDTDEPRISLNAISGIDGASTMRLVTRIADEQVVTIVDSDSTHNFITNERAQRIGLPLQPVRQGLRMVVANGDRIRSAGVVHRLRLQVATEVFDVDCFALDLSCDDIILGTQWLRTLGPILWDFVNMRMAIWRGCRELTLYGILDNRSTSTCAALHADDLLPSLLAEFDDLFTLPTGLPPTWSVDHRIHLKRTWSVGPYRYPQFQKDELEKQCADVLSQGIIRPSTSLFWSSVLLVRKHDVSWRFCVDYRALNTVTAKDKFPIPVIDELLDELHGAHFFSKLDLHLGYHQVRMQPDDVHKTAFHTHQGHFEFLDMPFGLTNVPATFQALMNTILVPFLCRLVLVFFDDI